MKKALVIIFAVALLGIAAAYVNPLGPETKLSSQSSNTASQNSASTAPPSGTQSQTASYKDGTFHGGDYSNQYGDLQVSVTISGGKITGVKLDQLNYFDGHSQEIDDYAVPILKNQTLSAQSASIDGVSGASYTSSAYMQSLQSALDKAKA